MMKWRENGMLELRPFTIPPLFRFSFLFALCFFMFLFEIVILCAFSFFHLFVSIFLFAFEPSGPPYHCYQMFCCVTLASYRIYK